MHIYLNMCHQFIRIIFRQLSDITLSELEMTIIQNDLEIIHNQQ